MTKVIISQNKVSIPNTCKKRFNSNAIVTQSGIENCWKFANDMVFGQGFHKKEAFGGNQPRNKSEILENTFQGKVAEVAFYNFCHSINILPDLKSDFGVWEQGQWEDIDFTFNDESKRVSVKSTKYFSNFLLLEKNRYDENGNYKETVEDNPFSYDFTFLIRLKGIRNFLKAELKDISVIQIEVTGFITHQRFLDIINMKQFLLAGTYLGNTPLKVDNYYECVNQLEAPSQFSSQIKLD